MIAISMVLDIQFINSSNNYCEVVPDTENKIRKYEKCAPF